MMTLDCICHRPPLSTIQSSLLDTFTAVREECPAIRELFVPDTIWPKFRAWHLKTDDKAYHASMLMLALERGHLGSFTSSAHRYLFKSGCLNPYIRKQYVNDLREQWMNFDDPMERHHKSRMFSGRIVELRCAEWLEEQGWTISSLEALQEGPDIVATVQNQGTTAFEVKFIGQDDGGFDTVMKSFRGEDACEMGSPSGAVDYLLFRAYQAAKQLQQSKTPARIALIVIDELTWHNFKIQLKDGWIDWKNPAFKSVKDPFLDEQRNENPGLDAELKPILGSIDAVWILKRSYGNQFARMY